MKWDLDSHTSSRSLIHPAGNLNNKPAPRTDHTTQPETEPALNRFALKPLVLGMALTPLSPGPGHGWSSHALSPTRQAASPAAVNYAKYHSHRLVGDPAGTLFPCYA